MAKTKKQKYLDSVWKLQSQCAKDGLSWSEFVKRLGDLNGGTTAESTTPPPGSTPPPPPQ